MLNPIDRSIQSVFLLYNQVFRNLLLALIVNAPVHISTLQEVEDGFAYGVKIKNADVLMVDGRPLDGNFRKPLDAVWNLCKQFYDGDIKIFFL